MTCVGKMLSVVMDGIKDVDMMIGYAEDGGEESEWFKSHAKRRLATLQEDINYVMARANISDRIREGDEVAEALRDHISSQIEMLHRRV